MGAEASDVEKMRVEERETEAKEDELMRAEAGASKTNLLNQKARVEAREAEAMWAEARKEADAAMAMAKPPDASMAEMKRKQADAAMAFAKPSDAIMAELKMALGAGSCKLSTMTSKTKQSHHHNSDTPFLF